MSHLVLESWSWAPWRQWQNFIDLSATDTGPNSAEGDQSYLLILGLDSLDLLLAESIISLYLSWRQPREEGTTWQFSFCRKPTKGGLLPVPRDLFVHYSLSMYLYWGQLPLATKPGCWWHFGSRGILRQATYVLAASSSSSWVESTSLPQPELSYFNPLLLRGCQPPDLYSHPVSSRTQGITVSLK